MLSNFNMFEHNQIYKNILQDLFIKTEAQKINIICLVKFLKDWDFPLFLSLL